MWLCYVSCAWVAGVFLGSKVSLPPLIILSGLLPLLLIPFLPDSRKTLIAAGLCLLVFFSGGLYYPSDLPRIDEHSLCFYNDKGTAEIQGTVTAEPDSRNKLCLLTFSASKLTMDGEENQVSGTTLVMVPPYPAYQYGDVLKLTGELKKPIPFDGFNYTSYLAGQGIYSVIYYPEIKVIGRGEGSKTLQWLYSLRESLSDSLARALPEPQGALAQAILLGWRGNIPDSLNQAFSRTGTAHLLAISGLHIGVVIAMVLSFGILIFGRRHSLYIWLALAVIWLYVLLTGMRPPVIRAAIMGSLFLTAEFLGRQRDITTALAFAAAVMVAIQPRILWSVSFQLSFLAMAGLALLYPRFQMQLRKAFTALHIDRGAMGSAGNMLADSFAASLAAITATWPLIAYYFGVVSLVALPATFFSLLALPAIIVSSSLVAFSGLFAAVMARVLGWLSWLFLSYLLMVVHGFDALPHSSLEVATISAWQIGVYYTVLATVIAWLSHRKQSGGSFTSLASGADKK